ncbi:MULTISPECIES: MarR family winged helix-turn-helix transcriptional regulator [Kordiimonas]|mgnify:CR=1 FL=1|jgi:DNA-binding MarR family transcriptional regulator|uniref:MarR family winged helix-turn-helix transcriptional regulator n=1 Tax=Kordiimonas TaxID=288021 RepID=UPI0025808C84|nr:MarR family transcriptional regulator [Kordiimonas sp. UBA4487]
MSNEDRLFVFHLLQQASGTLFRAADRVMRDREGITTAHQVVLFSLYRKEDVPASVLAAQLNMGKSRLTGLVDTLVDKGMVRRARSKEDGRSQLLSATESGRAVIDRTKAGVNEMNEDLLAPFSEEERRVISAFLKHVRDQGDEIVTRRSAPPKG